MKTEKKRMIKVLLIVLLAFVAFQVCGIINEFYALFLSAFLKEKISGEMLVILYKIGGFVITAFVSVPIFYWILRLEKNWKPFQISTKANLTFLKWLQYLALAMVFPALFIFAESILVLQGKLDTKNLGSFAVSDLVLNFFQYVCFMPVLEEFMFRGFLLKMLLPYGVHFAVTISAVCWSLGHGNPVNILMSLPIGFILGYLACKTQGLKYTILVHAAVNFFGNFMLPILLHFSIGQRTLPVVSAAFIVIGIVMFFSKRKELF